MARANVEVSPELKEIVERLVDKYEVALGDIDPDRILPLVSDANSKKNVIKIAPIKVPHPSVTNLRFAITAYSNKFDELDEARQALHILRELLRIQDFDAGKLQDYELKDFPLIIEEYGTLWEENEDLPNILAQETAADSTEQ